MDSPVSLCFYGDDPSLCPVRSHNRLDQAGNGFMEVDSHHSSLYIGTGVDPSCLSLSGWDVAGAGIEPQTSVLQSVLAYSTLGRMWGNSSTSRMDGESVSNITTRSIPTPRPPAGGIPCSNATI